MNASAKSFAFCAVVMLGLYGCAKTPLAPAGDERSAREKLQKIEAEHQAVVAARDQFRQKSLSLEQEQARLTQDLETLKANSARELASLNDQLKTRSAERDTLQVQYDGFRKNIKELIGQAEASLPVSPTPLASTSAEGNVARN